MNKFYTSAVGQAVYWLVSCLLLGAGASIYDQPRPWMPPNEVVTTAKATGRTTGHIVTLLSVNNTNEAIVVQPQVFLIPSNGRNQSYIGAIDDPILISPGSSVEIPVNGYCTDVSLPPIGSGESTPDLADWIPVFSSADLDGSSTTPPVSTVGSDPKAPPVKPVDLVFNNPVAYFTPADIPGILNDPGVVSREGNYPNIPITWPGTEEICPVVINQTKAPELFASIVGSVKESIEDTLDSLLADGEIVTPFSGNPERERSAIIQQLIWIITSQLDGILYRKGDFQQKMEEQFEEITGQNISDAPSQAVKQLESGVDDFWNAFMLVGAEAKVIKVDPEFSGLPFKDRINKGFGGHDISEVKAHNPPPAQDASGKIGAEAVSKGNTIAQGGSNLPDGGAIASEPAHVASGGSGNESPVASKTFPAEEEEADAVRTALGEMRQRPPKEKCLSGTVKTVIDLNEEILSGALLQLPDGSDLDGFLFQSLQEVPNGAILRTEQSRVNLLLMECTNQKWNLLGQFKMESESKVAFNEKNDSDKFPDIHLEYGSMVLNISTSMAQRGNTFLLTTRSNTIAVKGTAFSVKSTVQTEEVLVVEGCVEVRSITDNTIELVCTGNKWHFTPRE